MVDPQAIRALFANRWVNLLIWGSLAALTVGVLNSIRLTFLPTTLIVIIAIGAWLIFVSRRDDDDDDKPGNGSD